MITAAWSEMVLGLRQVHIIERLELSQRVEFIRRNNKGQ